MGTRGSTHDPASSSPAALASNTKELSPPVLTRRELLMAINVAMAAVGLAAPIAAEPAPADTPTVPAGPHKVREIETLWITMSDGTRIAARAWIPEDAEQH